MSENNEREYRVWCENGDLVAVTADVAEALSALADAEAEHVLEAHGGQADADECGVLTPHGYSIQVVEGDDDVTQDYLING